ncbi:hypothetical protein [Saccharothrix yanglingensis]|uniref:hypothetical protein n=1 Tax=Saccharothrix yanglingensis TaxID=659496 RepID=UPI0027D33C44|nr:hypothetical protein [Saccharothrix yanglingensis]
MPMRSSVTTSPSRTPASTAVALTTTSPGSSPAARPTPGRPAHSSTASTSTTLRENAASVATPRSNEVTGSFFSPETPSFTNPSDRPDSNTMRIAVNATTEPISANRLRAKTTSRIVRNTGDTTHNVPTSCRQP